MNEPLARKVWGGTLPDFIRERMASEHGEKRPSLRKLAVGSGIQVMYLSRALQGAEISFDAAKKLAGYLNCSLDDLSKHI